MVVSSDILYYTVLRVCLTSVDVAKYSDLVTSEVTGVLLQDFSSIITYSGLTYRSIYIYIYMHIYMYISIFTFQHIHALDRVLALSLPACGCCLQWARAPAQAKSDLDQTGSCINQPWFIINKLTLNTFHY